MAGTLTNHQKSGEYYRIAYKCAEVKDTQGCDGNCAACVLNVHLYVDDPREATLIKTSAALDYGKYISIKSEAKYNQLTWNLGQLLGWVLIIVSIWFGYRSCTKKDAPPTESSKLYNTGYETFNRVTGEAALYVKQHLRDVNRDGEINCIDRALLYKEYVPEARLIWNRNYANGWNHIFIGIETVPGEIDKLEPMVISEYMLDRYIDEYWAEKYDERYDKDVTKYYQNIKNNNFQWVWPLY
jgi:hypothetical protein